MTGQRPFQSCALSLYLHGSFLNLGDVHSGIGRDMPEEIQSYRLNMPCLPGPKVPKLFRLRATLCNSSIIDGAKDLLFM